jgi:hypothetical protein
MVRDDGAHPVINDDDLVRYLRDNYDIDEEGQPLAKADITAALLNARKIITDGQRVGSYTYYVGDQIAKIEGWAPKDDEEDDDPDDDI